MIAFTVLARVTDRTIEGNNYLVFEVDGAPSRWRPRRPTPIDVEA